MQNPNLSKVESGSSVGLASQRNNLDVSSSVRQSSATFDLSHQVLLTARFGEITPFFFMEGCGGDKIELRNSHDLRTYTFQSPLFSNMKMRKSYFSVPMSAIMPNVWSLLYVNPSKGEDIPLSALPKWNLHYVAYQLLKIVALKLDDIQYKYEHPEHPKTYVALAGECISTLKYQLTAINMLSKGSLLRYLGFPIVVDVEYPVLTSNSNIKFHLNIHEGDRNIDNVFDRVCDLLATEEFANFSAKCTYHQLSPSENIVSDYDYWLKGSNSRSKNRETLYQLLQHWNVSWDYGGTEESAILFVKLFRELFDIYDSAALQDYLIATDRTSLSYQSRIAAFEVLSNNWAHINPMIFFAYQMICSQFYSNDKVDAVYTSRLWYENMYQLYKFAAKNMGSDGTFKVNGVSHRFDLPCRAVIGHISQSLQMSNGAAIDFLNNLFGWRRSLKFGDYFLGARTQPLAVGDVDVAVNTASQSVNILDINKNLQIQRFLNAVNRTSSRLVEYCRDLFGFTPPKDIMAPNFISSTTSYLGNQEIVNTDTEQGNVNVNLRSNDSNYAFEIYLDEPSYVLGLCMFEATNSYQNSIDRLYFHRDRFEFFNPFLQHIGDQAIYRTEYDSSLDRPTEPFAYTNRYAEYKNAYNRACGGFLLNLPTWSKLTKVSFNDRRAYNLSPELIYSRPAELDEFYKSLTYADMASYFHFILSFANSVQANRKMDYYPNLMG